VLPLSDKDGLKLTGLVTYSALDALFLVQLVGLFLLPGYGLLRAFDGAKAATRTGLMVNMILEKGLAYARITLFISYVGLVFITEITYGRNHGIGG